MLILHPLAGSRFSCVTKQIREHGGVSSRAFPALAIMFVSHGLRYFSCELEKRRARKRALTALPMPDPIFVIGHWRSGTTLMANLLSLDPRFFFPTLVETVSPHDFFPSPLEKLSRRILPLVFPAYRPMDRAKVPLRGNYPQEDEMALSALGLASFFNAFYFPQTAERTVAREVFFDDLSHDEIENWLASQKGFVKKLALLHQGKIPLLKNPAHGGRIPVLDRAYPEARYILLQRDKADVLSSIKRLFETMWPAFSLQPYDLATLDKFAARTYDRMAARLSRDWQMVADRGIEVGYDQFVQSPVAVINQVYDRFGWNFSTQSAIEAYMREYGQ